jgi:hypothetical protein
MSARLMLSLLYALPGAVVAGLALQAAINLSAIYTGFKLKAAEQEMPVPPLAASYFRNTVKLLFMTAVGHLGLSAGDAVVALVAPGKLASRMLGYGGGMLLLVCAFGLLLQANVDRHLKLMSRRVRWTHLAAGMFGCTAAAWGMMLVTWKGGIWWP